MRETVHRIISAYTQNERTLWVREPIDGAKACDLIIFLDGEFYREQVGTAAILEELEAGSDLATNLLTVFVSHHSQAARWQECPCHPPFADFITLELLPWLESQYPAIQPSREHVLVGLSYTGLAAAYVALRSPGRFSKVIAQSGSFWSNDCWLAGEYAKLPRRLPTDFYLDVGTRETEENVRHKDDVLQVVSQVEGVRRFRDALLATGHCVNHREFDGGHDFTAWGKTLPFALRWALGNSGEPLAPS